MELKRCGWGLGDELSRNYHDQEWGVPVHDDRLLFEFLVLEGAQAGLSWITILRRRETYRQAFANFEPTIVAQYDEVKIEELLQDKGIIRNRRKVESAVRNAQAFLRVQEKFGSFDRYLWKFVEGKPIVNHWEAMHDVPAQTPLSQLISKDLKNRGFNFVGPTICYAYMQAIGMVNDHIVNCFRHQEISDQF